MHQELTKINTVLQKFESSLLIVKNKPRDAWTELIKSHAFDEVYVNEDYDEGGIIFQKKVTVLGTDTAEVVAEKIHDLEQRYFPEVAEKLITENSK